MDRQGSPASRRTDEPPFAIDSITLHHGNDRSHARAFVSGPRAVKRRKRHWRLAKMIYDGGNPALEHLRRTKTHGEPNFFIAKMIQPTPDGV
jgi:hypothetical protein